MVWPDGFDRVPEAERVDRLRGRAHELRPTATGSNLFARALQRMASERPSWSFWRCLGAVKLRRAPEVFGERPVGQGFGQMQPADLVGAIEVGKRAGNAQHAMITACRQPHGLGGVAQQF